MTATAMKTSSAYGVRAVVKAAVRGVEKGRGARVVMI
jgi:hypothetical protein